MLLPRRFMAATAPLAPWPPLLSVALNPAFSLNPSLLSSVLTCRVDQVVDQVVDHVIDHVWSHIQMETRTSQANNHIAHPTAHSNQHDLPMVLVVTRCRLHGVVRGAR